MLTTAITPLSNASGVGAIPFMDPHLFPFALHVFPAELGPMAGRPRDRTV